MRNYFYVRSKMVRIKLLAGYEFYEINKGKKTLLSLSASLERLFLYYIHTEQSIGKVAEWLRECWNKNITPMEIDKIIRAFNDDHPVEKIDEFSFEKNIPVYASKDEGLLLPLPGDWCTISYEHEEQLNKIISQHKDESLPYLKYWFNQFRNNYGIQFSKMKNLDIDYEMSVSFLNQHGFDEDVLTQEEVVSNKIDKETKYFPDTLLTIVLMLLPTILSFCWMWNNGPDISNSFIPFFIGGVVGITCLFFLKVVTLKTRRINISDILYSLFVGVVVAIVSNIAGYVSQFFFLY